jgi:DNA processing protein
VGQFNLNDSERTIYDYLNKEPLHLEQIIAGTDLLPGNTNAGLISLQLKGLVKQLPGSLFVRN